VKGGFETRVFVARDRTRGRPARPFPPLAKGGAGGVGTHASDTANGFPFSDTTGISNDLATGSFPCFPGGRLAFETAFKSHEAAGGKRSSEPRKFVAPRPPPLAPPSQGGERERGARRGCATNTGGIQQSGRGDFSSRHPDPHFARGGKKMGRTPTVRSEYRRCAVAPQRRTCIRPACWGVNPALPATEHSIVLFCRLAVSLAFVAKYRNAIDVGFRILKSRLAPLTTVARGILFR